MKHNTSYYKIRTRQTSMSLSHLHSKVYNVYISNHNDRIQYLKLILFAPKKPLQKNILSKVRLFPAKTAYTHHVVTPDYVCIYHKQS